MDTLAVKQALLDLALEDERALESSAGGFARHNAVVRALALKLKPVELIDRIKYSPFASSLMEEVPSILGASDEALEEVMQILRETHESWPGGGYHGFISAYWRIRTMKWIALHDYRRAWDDIKKAVMVDDHDPLRPSNHSTFLNILRLAQAMRLKGLIDYRIHDGINYPKEVVLPGLRVLRQLYPNLCESISSGEPTYLRAGFYTFDESQQAILAIAAHFAQERNAKRKKRLERAAR